LKILGKFLRFEEFFLFFDRVPAAGVGGTIFGKPKNKKTKVQ